jgi:phenylpyruvate tautomerase PptA (4-oxalocrotonate tautomerase family)
MRWAFVIHRAIFYKTRLQKALNLVLKINVMPFVNIYLPAALSRDIRKQISLAVHGSLMEIFAVPEKDYFQVIHPVDEDNLIFPNEYFDIPHTGNLVYIYITCAFGRTVDMKKALYNSIAKKIAERTLIKPDDVLIFLNETPLENWSFGRGIAQMIS